MIEKSVSKLKRLVKPSKKRKIRKFRDLVKALHEHKDHAPKKRRKRSPKADKIQKLAFVGRVLKETGLFDPSAWLRRKAMGTLFSGNMNQIGNRISNLSHIAPHIYGWGKTLGDYGKMAKWQEVSGYEPRGFIYDQPNDSAYWNPDIVYSNVNPKVVY